MLVTRIKQKPGRTLLPLSGLLLSFLLAGCQPVENALSGLRKNEIMRNAARGFLLGQAYDRVAIAQRNQDKDALQAATAELSRLDPQAAAKLNRINQLTRAEEMVREAVNIDMRAERLPDGEQKRKLEAQAAQKYREALRISPQFPSQNADLLNALGYFLADRGTSRQDFQTAERLTRQALKQWDAMLEQLKDAPLAGNARSLMQFSRAHGPQDSLAWALFKQKKYNEAAREQKEVLKITEQTASEIGQPIAADLYYHYAEIERARGNIGTARTNYQLALQLEPDHKASRDALATLPPVKPAAPKPSPVPPPQTPTLPQPGLTA